MQELQARSAMAALVSCSLIVKRVRTGEYVYAQGRVADGSSRQVYLGPYDAEGRTLVERFFQARRETGSERSALDITAKVLRAAGMPALDPVEWRVVNALAEAGVFRVGGVLAGTIAYRCIGNLLGVKMASASAVTADVDVAAKTVPVAVIPEVASPQTALERLKMGFSPMVEADPVLFGARFQARQGEFKVEFLTPEVPRRPSKKRAPKIRQLGVPAVPLRFLDYLIEGTLPAVALGRRPVLVRVPEPARFAVHKLIVSQERQKRFSLKSQKDLEQSFDLQQALQMLDPESLAAAFEDACQRGPGWRRRVQKGREAMDRIVSG
jgi:hypothetical protein